MFSQKSFRKQSFISAIPAVIVLLIAVVGFVYGATTIGTNVSVDGNLVISGTTATSTFSTGGLAVGTNQFIVQQTSGKVGIGTTSPTSLLHVGGAGTAKFNGAIGVGTSNPRQSDGYGFVAQSDVKNGGSALAVVDRSEWATSIEGYVGIPGFDFFNDTSQASFLLDAIGRLPGSCNSSYVQQQCYSTTLFTQASNGLNIAATGNAIRFMVDSANANLFSTERMRIDVSGNVGIGTTTPYSRFHVSRGASATTTVNFGEVGSATSKACFNTKNVSGADISFYFNAANALVVESNLCR